MNLIRTLLLVSACCLPMAAQETKSTQPMSMSDQIAAVSNRFKSAASKEELSTLFTLCAAVCDEGKRQVTSAAGKTQLGGLYTKYLRYALMCAQPDFVKASLEKETENHKLLVASSKSSDELAGYISTVLRQSVSLSESHKDELVKYSNAMKLPGKSDGITIPGKTLAVDVIAALGKPFREDYNQDGRFVYNFETSTGFDVFLFDQGNCLIRNRAYTDKLKSK